ADRYSGDPASPVRRQASRQKERNMQVAEHRSAFGGSACSPRNIRLDSLPKDSLCGRNRPQRLKPGLKTSLLSQRHHAKTGLLGAAALGHPKAKSGSSFSANCIESIAVMPREAGKTRCRAAPSYFARYFDPQANVLLERLLLRLVPGRLSIQPGNQFTRAGRNADLSLADNLPGAQLSSIEILVGAAVGTQSRSFQRNSGEQSFIARVGENLRVHDDVCRTLGRASLWAGGGGGIGAQFHLARKQR